MSSYYIHISYLRLAQLFAGAVGIACWEQSSIASGSEMVCVDFSTNGINLSSSSPVAFLGDPQHVHVPKSIKVCRRTWFLRPSFSTLGCPCVGKNGWISVTSGTSLHMLSAITKALRLVLSYCDGLPYWRSRKQYEGMRRIAAMW